MGFPDNIVNGTEYCDFGEITKAISGPLPDINITYDPERPSIGPDQEKIVVVTVQPHTNSFSNVTLRVDKGDSKIQSAIFRDSKDTTTDNVTTLDIPPNGWSTTQLEIKGLLWNDGSTIKDSLWNTIATEVAKWDDIKENHPITLEITANITSSSREILSGTDTIARSNIDSSPIEKRSSLTLDVLSPYDSILAEFSALSASGAVDIIIAIGSAIVGLVVGIFGKDRIERLLGQKKQ